MTAPDLMSDAEYFEAMSREGEFTDVDDVSLLGDFNPNYTVWMPHPDGTLLRLAGEFNTAAYHFEQVLNGENPWDIHSPLGIVNDLDEEMQWADPRGEVEEAVAMVSFLCGDAEEIMFRHGGFDSRERWDVAKRRAALATKLSAQLYDRVASAYKAAQRRM